MGKKSNRKKKRWQQERAIAIPRSHRAVLAELRELRRVHPELLLEVREHRFATAVGIRVRISTKSIHCDDEGLPIASFEDVVIYVPPGYPDVPPTVLVEHDRFLGYPHVLLGRILCIYLDPSREWHPASRGAHVLKRIMDWFADAAGARFDAGTALFHAIGGLPPQPFADGTVVVRRSPPTSFKALALGAIAVRSKRRMDLAAWRLSERPDPPLRQLLVVQTREFMPHGLGRTLEELVARAVAAGGPDARALVDAIARQVSTSDPGAAAYVGVVVPHPTVRALSQVAVGEIPHEIADKMRTTSVRDWSLSNIYVRWFVMSDERTDVTQRRDASRPTAAFAGKTVELWGCGGLGSWIGEFVARSSPAEIVLRDPAPVGSGLLVRQDYVELDVGAAKASALAERLSAISDSIDVRAEPSNVLTLLSESGLPKCDVLIDATVNVTVAARLDDVARRTEARPLMVQVTTDARTATFGLVAVAASDAGFGPATVDDDVSKRVLEAGELERFHGFWTSAEKREQVVPAPGCSIPTFHGSAADLGALAGSMVSLIAQQMRSPKSGAHLLAAAHAGGTGAGHVFLASQPG